MSAKNDEEALPTQTANSKPRLKKSANDFKFGKIIGQGSFATVYLSKDVHTNKEFAIKVCEKRHIIREKKQKAIMREKQIMNILNDFPSPFFIKLFCTFQDEERLYFVMNYASHGEMLPYIIKVGSFDEECARFYCGEILLALDHLHNLNIVHRDLKPENILLDQNMHIQITDFGSAKILNAPEAEDGSTRKNSFVGTAQYVSPEMLTDKKASTSSDLWALGCIIYQMVSGLPPFRAPNEYFIFQKIMKLEYEFPDGFHSNAKDLVQKLLVTEPQDRLGATEVTVHYTSLKNHPFFEGLPWETLSTQTPPQILPYLPGTSSNAELRGEFIEPGLDDEQLSKLMGLLPPAAPAHRKISALGKSPQETEERLTRQARENPWHRFVEGNLILRQGLVDKRKGLFARRRMLLLTTGPHLYYVDPQNMVLKGQIPWSEHLRAEPKNFKTFFVHTPNRTYYLEDTENFALEWCRAIEEVRESTYKKSQPATSS